MAGFLQRTQELQAVHWGNLTISAVYKGAVLLWEAALKIWKGKQVWKGKEVWKY